MWEKRSAPPSWRASASAEIGVDRRSSAAVPFLLSGRAHATTTVSDSGCDTGLARGRPTSGRAAAQRVAIGQHRRYRAYAWGAGYPGEAHPGCRVDSMAGGDRARRRAYAAAAISQAL